MLERLRMDDTFFDRIIWTDEACFATNSVYNRHNTHYWSQENPRLVKAVKTSGWKAFSIWCGVVGDRILGPIFYEGGLTGDRYYQFLTEEIENFLDELPLNILNRSIWQQDGAPAHNTANVTHFLNEKYETWVGKNGSIRWCPNSPDLTLMDRSFWGWLKERVHHEHTFHKIADLRRKILEEIQFIRIHRKQSLRDAVHHLKTCYRLCVEQNGGHFEHLLK